MLDKVLKELRAVSGITQQRLADELGVSKGAVAMWETGKRMPEGSMLVSIAKFFGVSVVMLLGVRSDVELPANARAISSKRLPLLGNVACGEPIFAEQEVEAYVSSDCDINADFCLRAVGDSMINARIFDGDILFVKSQNIVDDGEIAVVLIEDEATVKRFFYDRENNTITLMPENPMFKPLRFSGAQLNAVRVLGKVIAGQYNVK